VRRAERAHTRLAEPARVQFDAIGEAAAAERAAHCSVPKEGGWRPGARWARSDPAGGANPAGGADSAEGGSALADSRAEVTAAITALPAHQRPPQRELGRVSEVLGSPFRPMPPDEAGASPSWAQPSLQFPGEDAPAKAARGVGVAAARKPRVEHYRNEAPSAPSLAQLAAMPSVQFPGEGPHPDDHGKSDPTTPSYGEGRFFQTGRTLRDVVARVCPEDGTGSPRAVPGGTPLVTVHKIGARVEIAAACPVALALGLRAGIALTQARVQVPGLGVRDADPAGDRVDLEALAHLLARRWTPVVAISDADGLFLDLTGVAHLHGGEARMIHRLHRLLARHGVTARIAVADSAGAAWALARFGAREVEVAPSGASAALMAALPVQALRLDTPSLELLARLGVDTVGRLQALPRAPLVRRFGPAITARLDQALGRAPEPLDPVTPPRAIAVSQRFAEPIATPEAIAHWLGELCDRLARALAEAGQGARAVELVAARVDGVPQRLRVGFAHPTRDAAHMLRLATRRIEEIAPGYGIDALTMHVRRADPLGPESFAPALAEETSPDLAPLVDALANRIGEDRLWRMAPVESDVPERSVTPCPPLDPPPDAARALRADDVRGLDRTAPDHPWHPRWPRPVRLLHRPEQVDHVLAELPDQPPRRFTWRGRTHLVVRADGPERIAGEWWRRPTERSAVRDYFQVEDESGKRFWLYRRGDGLRAETGDLRWFLHGR